ncbi:MAG: hypothetical protein Q7P63_07935 [Verrucomicrobiota bacterium JB022]|nr:hypothetical protein [Verrucomicrobiota bacterium JB022]
MKSVLLSVTALFLASLSTGCVSSKNVTLSNNPQTGEALVANGASLNEIVNLIEKEADFDIDVDIRSNRFRSITLRLARRATWEQTLQDLANLYGLRLVKLDENEYRLSD